MTIARFHCSLLLLFLLLSPVHAHASSSTWSLVEIPAVLLVTPAGDGTTLAGIGNVLTVTFMQGPSDPIAFHPVPCIVFTYEGTQGYLETDLPADHDTDANGTTTFSGGVAGGGWSQEGLYLYANSCSALPWLEVVGVIPVHFNSPDLDGNGIVDLADVATFAQDFVVGYHFRSDLHYDGRLDLADVGRFAMHLGERRP